MAVLNNIQKCESADADRKSMAVLNNIQKLVFESFAAGILCEEPCAPLTYAARTKSLADAIYEAVMKWLADNPNLTRDVS
jgi:hypothetical protein